MYEFSYLLQKPEAHDVVFKAADGSSAGFCKTLLLGLSEVWRTRDEEHWSEPRDQDGRICHTVDLDLDTSQAVLDALQAAVFTGKLPCCSWQVLVQLAKLADAELMPTMLQLTTDALKGYDMQEAVAVVKAAPEEASHLVLRLESAIGHIQHDGLLAWLKDAACQLVDPIAEKADLMTVLLNELPVNCMAALGVLRAAWANMPDGELPSMYTTEGKAYQEAILRHKQVMLDQPSREFICFRGWWSSISDSLVEVLKGMCRTLLGPPADVLSTPEAFNSFWAKVAGNGKLIYHLWRLYVDGPDPDYLRVMVKVRERLQALRRDAGWRDPAFQAPPDAVIMCLCDDPDIFVQLSADDLEQLMLPVLDWSVGNHALISAVKAMIIMKRQGVGKGRRRRRGGAGRNNWAQHNGAF